MHDFNRVNPESFRNLWPNQFDSTIQRLTTMEALVEQHRLEADACSRNSLEINIGNIKLLSEFKESLLKNLELATKKAMANLNNAADVFNHSVNDANSKHQKTYDAINKRLVSAERRIISLEGVLKKKSDRSYIKRYWSPIRDFIYSITVWISR